MSIYRCNSCGFIAEVLPIEGQQAFCGRCAKPVTVYGTVFFVEKLLQRYALALREIKVLKAAQEEEGEVEVSAAAPASTKGDAPVALDNAFLPTQEQHAPLQSWFDARSIQAKFAYDNVNMDGYFDEAARQIGEHYELLADVLGRIGWSYRKSHSGLNIELARLAQKDAATITRLCRNWYGGALFAKYFYQKNEKVLRLGLQPAQPARQFFMGSWLEWFAIDALLNVFGQNRQQSFSCARGVKVVFPNEDLQELDAVALVGERLVSIECKTGEFRHEIDKLSRLQKRIGQPAEQFIICAAQLDAAQAQGLSSMYGMTFTNVQTLVPHLQRLAQRR